MHTRGHTCMHTHTHSTNTRGATNIHMHTCTRTYERTSHHAHTNLHQPVHTRTPTYTQGPLVVSAAIPIVRRTTQRARDAVVVISAVLSRGAWYQCHGAGSGTIRPRGASCTGACSVSVLIPTRSAQGAERSTKGAGCPCTSNKRQAKNTHQDLGILSVCHPDEHRPQAQ